jgi:low temperature requirement protein LtrA
VRVLHRSKTPLELFFDHCFVVAVAQASSLLHHDLSGSRIGHALGNLPLGVFAIGWAG